MIQSGPKMTQNGPQLPQMAQKWRPDLRTFSAIFFDWKSSSANFFALRMYALKVFMPFAIKKNVKAQIWSQVVIAARSNTYHVLYTWQHCFAPPWDMAELWIGLSATREGTGPSLLLPLLQDSHLLTYIYLLMLTIAATDCLVPSGEDSALTATREGSATTCHVASNHSPEWGPQNSSWHQVRWSFWFFRLRLIKPAW